MEELERLAEELIESGQAFHDYHQVLGVSHNATRKQIKDVYKRLAFVLHPDRNLSTPMRDRYNERFKSTADAYAILTDPQKRHVSVLRLHVHLQEGY